MFYYSGLVRASDIVLPWGDFHIQQNLPNTDSAMTFSIMALSIMTFSKMSLSIMAFSITRN